MSLEKAIASGDHDKLLELLSNESVTANLAHLNQALKLGDFIAGYHLVTIGKVKNDGKILNSDKLSNAIKSSNPLIVRLSLQAGVKVNSWHITQAIKKACKLVAPQEASEIWTSSGDLNIHENGMNSPLEYSILVLSALMSKGCDSIDETHLSLALKNKQEKLAEYFIDTQNIKPNEKHLILAIQYQLSPSLIEKFIEQHHVPVFKFHQHLAEKIFHSCKEDAEKRKDLLWSSSKQHDDLFLTKSIVNESAKTAAPLFKMCNKEIQEKNLKLPPTIGRIIGVAQKKHLGGQFFRERKVSAKNRLSKTSLEKSNIPSLFQLCVNKINTSNVDYKAAPTDIKKKIFAAKQRASTS